MKFASLKESFLNDTEKWPSFKVISRACKVPPKISNDVHLYDLLKKGEAVPVEFMKVFLGVLNAQSGRKYTLTEIADAVLYPQRDTPSDIADNIDPKINRPIENDGVLAQMIRKVVGPCVTALPAYCNDPKSDIRFAANLVFHDVGRLEGRVGDEENPGDPLDADSCYKRGLTSLSHFGGFDKYVKWLTRIQRACPLSVMFPCISDRSRKGEFQRVGVNVMIPLIEEAFRGLTCGELGDNEICPEHIETPSKYLLIHVMTHVESFTEGNMSDKRREQVLSSFFQGAMLRDRDSPAEIAAAARDSNATAAQALRHYGFYKLGVAVKGTDVPIWKFPMRHDVLRPNVVNSIHYLIHTAYSLAK